MRIVNRCQSVLLAGLLVAASANAEELTPSLYVQIDQEVREITIFGMQERLSMLAEGADDEQQINASLAVQQSVGAVFAAHGTTAEKHAAYGTRNAEGIAAWLEENPQWKQSDAELARRFNALVAQFPH
jgi:hypothetical protein